MTTTSLPPLGDRHQLQLEQESSISAEVIAARGYRTLTKKVDLERLGFGQAQRSVPALLIPVRWTENDAVLHQSRPDSPRLKAGKAIKYETPNGSSMRMDVSPVVKHLLSDPSTPLFVTEGVKKGDALASRGVCAVALLGVWNWRGTNESGGKTALAQWEDVALNGRDVLLAFDSDVMHKRAVHGALSRLSEFLKQRKAKVRVVYLPDGDGGRKQGVDDFFAAGGSLDDLYLLARDGLQPLPDAPTSSKDNSVSLLDTAPECLRRPLARVGEHTYAAAWPWLQRTTHSMFDKKEGKVTVFDPPLVSEYQTMVVVRDDGQLFADEVVSGAKQLMDIEVKVALPAEAPSGSTWSGAGIRRYAAGERAEPGRVVAQVAAVINCYMDFDRSLADQATMCDMTACYVLAGYMLDAFASFGYLWSNGDKGAGKTTYFVVVARLACMGLVVTAGGSFATLRDMADVGATIAFDDAERVMDPKKGDPDKQALLLAGSRRGTTVPFKEKKGDNWVTRHVDVFCPRLFSAIRMPDSVMASRTIMVPLIRSSDPSRASADPLEDDTWPHPRGRLIDNLWALGLANLDAVKQWNRRVPEHTKLTGRPLQPWRPILAVALWLQKDHGVAGIFDRLHDLALRYQEDRADLELPDPVVLTLTALQEMFAAQTEREMRFEAAEVAERVNRIARERDLPTYKEGEGYTNSRRIGKMLGKTMRLRRPKRQATARPWLITRQELDSLAQSYGLPPNDMPNGPATGEDGDEGAGRVEVEL